MWKYFWAQNINVKNNIVHKKSYLWSNRTFFFFPQWTTSMKNRILCILFLHYQDFLHHSVKNGSDVFIYKTPHTSISCLKTNPPLSNPHHIANLMHTIHNTNKLLMRKFSQCVAAQLSAAVPNEHNLWRLKCSAVCQYHWASSSWHFEDLLTKLQCYIPQDFNLWQHCCDLQSHTTQSTFIILVNGIKQELSIHKH